MRKRLFALLLTVLMIAGLLPGGVYAQEPSAEATPVSSALAVSEAEAAPAVEDGLGGLVPEEQAEEPLPVPEAEQTDESAAQTAAEEEDPAALPEHTESPAAPVDGAAAGEIYTHVNGSSWPNSPAYVKSVTVTGATVASSSWSGDTCTVLLEGGTADDASLTLTFSRTGQPPYVNTMVIAVDGTAVASNGKCTVQLSGGKKTIEVSVTPQGGASVSRTFVFEVNKSADQNHAPKLAEGVGETVQRNIGVGKAFALDLTQIFSDEDGDALTYSVKVGDGEAVSADASYSFTPETAGTYTLVFTASDGEKGSPAYTVTLTAGSSDTAIGILVNNSNKATNSSPSKAVVGADGILRVEERTDKVGYIWLSLGEGMSVESFTILQGLTTSNITPAQSKRSSNNVFDGTTYQYYYSSTKYTLPIVASVRVLAADGETSKEHYLIVDDEPAGSYIVRATGFTASSDIYDEASGIRFTAAEQSVALTPVTESIGSGADKSSPWVWKSSDPTVALVDANGLVRSVGGGEATITAECGYVTVSCTVSSTAPKHSVHSYDDGVCSVCGTKEPAAVSAFFTLVDGSGSFAVAKDNSTELYKAALTVSDADCDGKLTLNDAFLEAHKAYCSSGAAGYVTEESQYGAYISSFWGVSGGSVGYFRNDASVSGLTETVKKNDEIAVFFYRDTTQYTDLYTWFAQDSGKVVVGQTRSFCVSAADSQVPKGAAVTVCDSTGAVLSDLSATVDESGSFSLTFPAAGSYTVQVSGTAAYDFYGTPVSGAPVVPARMTVEAFAEASATVYVTISDKSGDYITGKDGDVLYRIPVTAKDDPEDPDGQVSLREVLVELHRQHHPEGVSAVSVSGSWVGKLWGDTSGSFGYYFNDVYMEGYGAQKTGTNGREFKDQLMDTVVADGVDCLNIWIYQSSSWSDLYTYFTPVQQTAAAGEETSFTVSGNVWGSAKAPEGAVIRVYNSTGTEETSLNTTVDAGGSFRITFPAAGTYRLELRSSTEGSSKKYFVPSSCLVTVSGPAADSVSLDATELKLKVGDTRTLSAAVLPENADKTLSWSSSDNLVASVSDTGLVTAVGKGTATVTVTTASGKTAECAVTVEDAAETVGLSVLKFASSSSASAAAYAMTPAFDPAVTEYTVVVPDSTASVYVWATLSEGGSGTIKANYKNTSNADKSVTLTSGKSTGTSLSQAVKSGSFAGGTITVSAGSGTVYTVKIVRQATLSSLSITADGQSVTLTPAFGATKTEYTADVPYDALLNFTAKVKTSGATVTVNGAAATEITPVWTERAGEVELRVIGGEGVVDGVYTIRLQQLATGIEILTPPTKTEYEAGDSFDPAGMTLKATYSDGFAETIGSDAFTWEPGGKLSPGVSSVQVSFDGLTVSQSITMAAVFEGKGTETDPYLIKTQEDLVRLSALVADGLSFEGEYFRMVNSITLPDAEGEDAWVPLGLSKTNPFSGSFDGGGNLLTVPEGGLPLIGFPANASLRNLNVYGRKIAGYGVVNGYAVGNSNVPAITIENVTLKAGTQTLKSGFIGGYASGSNTVIIRNCTVEQGVVIGYDKSQKWIGSFGGEYNGIIDNCVSYADVYGTDFVGGIVSNKGQSMGDFAVTNCKFYGTVTATGHYVGGIVGHGYGGTGWGFAPNAPCVTIQNCVCSGSVTGADYVGGILGGDAGVAQCWENGIGYIQSNRFTGTVKATGGSYVGGVIGYLLSLNKYNEITNNYYSVSCGAARGIGAVKYVDTSCATHETASGATYLNTENGTSGCPAIQNGSWKAAHNRTDDPLGADAAKLCYTDTQTAPVATELKISGSCKTVYETGEALDLSGLVLTVVYSDSSAKNIALSEIAITGWNSGKAGEQTLTLSWQGLTATLKVTVKNPAGEITVTVSVLGDSAHGAGGGSHTLTDGNLTTWVSARSVKIDSNASVWDALKKVFSDCGIAYSYNTDRGTVYLESLTYNGITLAEFTNGSESGWMYTINGYHPLNGVDQQYLKNGDVIVLHYTDDYPRDSGFGGSSDDEEAVTEVEKLIDAIGTVTLGSKAAIDAARRAYDALPAGLRLKVENYARLTAAEAAYKALKRQDDEQKAGRVEEMIENLVFGSDSFAENVRAAKEAYDALSEEQKKMVDNYDYLADALKQLAAEEDKEAAEAVEERIDAIGDVTLDSEEAILAAREAYEALTEEQKALVSNLRRLEAAEEKLAALKALDGVRGIYEATGDYIEGLGAAATGSVGGEWMILGLARSGRTVPGAADYLENLRQYIEENIDENGRLHQSKSTENSRIILALTALGEDAGDVDGISLLRGLGDIDFLQKQGINGPIWALIALDCGNYPVPEGNVTREALLRVILDAQCPDGGWALSGDVSDTDMTGMALQALAPYAAANDEVRAAVDKALAALSAMQAQDGSFGTMGDGGMVATSESIAQVITALSALGIDAHTDERFVKNGVSALDALCAYFVEGGGFRHLLDGGLDGMATEQAYYALTAYFRMLDGRKALYDMTDVVDMGGDVTADAPVETPAEEKAEAAPEAPEAPETDAAPEPEDERSGGALWIVGAAVVAAGAAAAIAVRGKKRKHTKVR